MSIATIVVYSPSELSETPMALRRFLRCRISRVTIMSVRMMLSERETKKYEVAKWIMALASSDIVETWQIYTTPIAVSVTLVNVLP